VPRITPISSERLVKIFERVGFRFVRQESDHLVYTKPRGPRPIVIPVRKDVPVFVIKNNLRTAGISREEYFKLLEEV
jgi:predicted RNA binding protein YcfA (HicA-like mRNA interferase family)